MVKPSTFDRVVVLVRHGEALPAHEDPLRSLSKNGGVRAGQTGAALARLLTGIHEIRHSGKARARETAEIVARIMPGSVPVVETSGLMPNDDPETIATDLEHDRRSLMLVGHLPFMGRLASRLLTGSQQGASMMLVDAGFIVLGWAHGRWHLVVSGSPDLTGG